MCGIHFSDCLNVNTVTPAKISWGNGDWTLVSPFVGLCVSLHPILAQQANMRSTDSAWMFEKSILTRLNAGIFCIVGDGHCTCRNVLRDSKYAF